MVIYIQCVSLEFVAALAKNVVTVCSPYLRFSAKKKKKKEDLRFGIGLRVEEVRQNHTWRQYSYATCSLMVYYELQLGTEKIFLQRLYLHSLRTYSHLH